MEHDCIHISSVMRSVASLVAEHGPYLGVVGVHGSQRMWNMGRKEVPDLICPERLADNGGMYTSHLGHELSGVVALGHPLGDDVAIGKVEVVHVEVFKGCGVDDVLVDGLELPGTLGGEGAEGSVGVQPAVARIERPWVAVAPSRRVAHPRPGVGICHSEERVRFVVHDIVVHFAVKVTKEDHRRAFGEFGVQLLERRHHVGLVLTGSGHAADRVVVGVADVVGNLGVEHEGRCVEVVGTGGRVDELVGKGPRAHAVNGDVLIIPKVAVIALVELLVDRIDAPQRRWTVALVDVRLPGSAPRAFRPRNFAQQHLRPFIEMRRFEGNVEVGACGI
mmetsp:Transcript_74004/g.173755  ORF Transcript_74004/g.173755 Transcript_74004/m.173755 type:complete len:334 (+) Transcript_74004:10-1011(+)